MTRGGGLRARPIVAMADPKNLPPFLAATLLSLRALLRELAREADAGSRRAPLGLKPKRWCESVRCQRELSETRNSEGNSYIEISLIKAVIRRSIQ